jgi:phosphoglycolate phosphatase-like HAD superfamily hydrolase
MREPTSLPLDRIQAFLFDLDGTLIESDDHWVAKLSTRLEPLARLSRRWEAESLARALVMAVETPSNYAMSALEHLGLGSSFFGLADRLRRARGLATRDLAETVQGSEALLETLAPRFKLAVVTTRARPEAYAFLERSGLERFFPVVITRQDVLRMKPHPEPVRTAAGMLGVPPEACAMVGDTVADVRAARRAGAVAIGVLSGFGRRQELERAGADLVLDYAVDLLSLPEWEEQRG